MGVRDAWQALWRTKQSAGGPLLVRAGIGQPRFTPRRYDRLAEEGYRKNVIAYRCVRLIAQNAAAVPWRLSHRRGGRRQLAEHPLIDLLSRPNPMQGGAELFDALYQFFLIAGNSFLEAVGPERRPPRELWTLRPDRMTVIPGPRGLPRAYRFSVGGEHLDFSVDPLTGQAAVLHIKLFHSLNDWYGMSPLEAAAYSIDQHNEAGRWNTALLQNSARPSGALVYAPKGGGQEVLSDTQREALKAELRAFSQGGANAGEVPVFEGGLEWREMSLSPKDMDWLAGKDMSAREIALAYNVPPQLVGIEGSLTFANFEQARLSLYEDAVLPLLDMVTDELNNWLVPAFGDDLSLDFDRDEIPALAPRRAKVWARIGAANFLTPNEKRALVGLAPLPAGVDVAPAAQAPDKPSEAVTPVG